MVNKDLVVVNAVSDVLEIKSSHSEKLDEEIIKYLIKKKDLKLKESEEDLLYLAYADRALKIKHKTPKLSKKEIIQQVLDELK